MHVFTRYKSAFTFHKLLYARAVVPFGHRRQFNILISSEFFRERARAYITIYYTTYTLYNNIIYIHRLCMYIIWWWSGDGDKCMGVNGGIKRIFDRRTVNVCKQEFRCKYTRLVCQSEGLMRTRTQIVYGRGRARQRTAAERVAREYNIYYTDV